MNNSRNRKKSNRQNYQTRPLYRLMSKRSASFAIAQIKETALPPLPLEVVRTLTRVALTNDLKIGSKARIMLEAELAVWKQIVLKRHGKFKARTKVIEVYGEELADLLFCVPPINGTLWEVGSVLDLLFCS